MKISFVPKKQIPFGDNADYYLYSESTISINLDIVKAVDLLTEVSERSNRIVMYFEKEQMLSIWFFLNQLKLIICNSISVELVYKTGKGYFVSNTVKLKSKRILN